MHCENMAGCFVYVALLWTVFSQLRVRGVSSQPASDLPTHHIQPRSATICNSWSSWINNNHPSPTDKTDRERISQADLETSCPPSLGGTVTQFHCKDKRGEPFSGNRTSTADNYDASCEDVSSGVVCILLDPVNGECPDFAMQYYCHCPANYTPPDTTGRSTTIGTVSAAVGHTVTTNTRYTGTAPSMPTSQIMTTKPTVSHSPTLTNILTITKAKLTVQNSQTSTDNPGGTNITPTSLSGEAMKAKTMESNTTSERETVRDPTVNIGGQEVSTWLVMLISCGLMFIINCIFTVIIYRRLRSKINKHYKHKTQVQPISLV